MARRNTLFLIPFCLKARRWSFIMFTWLSHPLVEAPPNLIVTKSFSMYLTSMLCR